MCVRSTLAMVEDMRYQRLPQSFSVRELGSSEARGLWGIKHTRKPVDLMVAKAKNSSTPLPPQVELRITEDGCEIIGNKIRNFFPIHTVSYGVQVSVGFINNNYSILDAMTKKENKFQMSRFRRIWSIREFSV